MKSFGYYTYNDPNHRELNHCSRESDEYPVMVNCAGNFVTEYPFTTVNRSGRLDYYLMFIVTGSLTVFDGAGSEEKREAAAGSLFIIRPGNSYKYVFDGEGSISYFWVHFTGREVEETLTALNVPCFPTICEVLPDNRIARHFQSLFDAFSPGDSYRDRELSALLERLLVTVARSLRRDGVSTSGLLARSIKHIGSSYSSDIRVPDLAKMEHLSVSRYNYLFKRQMGISPTKYILSLRISFAKELLDSTDMSVKQIGAMCGYPDPHFFSKTFKSATGLTPMEYRTRDR